MPARAGLGRRRAGGRLAAREASPAPTAAGRPLPAGPASPSCEAAVELEPPRRPRVARPSSRLGRDGARVVIDFADLEDLERIYRRSPTDPERDAATLDGDQAPCLSRVHRRSQRSDVVHSLWSTLWITVHRSGARADLEHDVGQRLTPSTSRAVAGSRRARRGIGPAPRRRGLHPARPAPCRTTTARRGPSSHTTAGIRVSRSTGSRMPGDVAGCAHRGAWPARAAHRARPAAGRRRTRSPSSRSRRPGRPGVGARREAEEQLGVEGVGLVGLRASRRGGGGR